MPGDGRQPAQAVREAGQLQPGREETGGLGALAGRDDDEHGLSLPVRAGHAVIDGPANLARRTL